MIRSSIIVIIIFQDCTPLQEYNKRECQCVCKNLEAQDKCNEETKIWNSKTCICECAQEEECTTGFKFDLNTCRCVILKVPKNC